MTSPNPARDEAVALLPCPFCGSEARHEERHNPMSRWKHSIDCRSSSCGMSGPVASSKAEAVRLWNDRAARSAAKPPASGVDAADDGSIAHFLRLLDQVNHYHSDVRGDAHDDLIRFCQRHAEALRASLSPAATSGSEAGGEPAGLVAKLRVGALHHEVPAWISRVMVEASEALAKPASSPAGGDVLLEAELSRLRFELANSFSARHGELMAEALAEIKASVDGDSEQPVRDIVYGLIAEIEALPKLAALSPSTSAAEPVAWMDDGSTRAGSHDTAYRVVTAATKAAMPKAAAEAYRTPLYTHPAPAAVDGQRVKEVRRVRHKKRGTTYRVLHGAVMQSTHWHDTRFKVPADGRAVVVYQSEDDGSVWARPATEFEDGRFEDLRACLATAKEGA